MQRSVEAIESMSGKFHGKLLALTVALVAAGIVSGCSTTPQKKSSVKTSKTVSQNKKAQQGALLDSSSIDSLEGLLSATDMAAVEDNKLAILRYGDVWRRMRAGFKMNLNVENSRITGQRSWFTSRQPYIDRLSARASRYLYHTVTEAERRGIPTELALLPIIESSYDPAATSSAAAAGMWQFIPSTGTIYGLRQNSIYDGRRDVVESTRAAYEFLTSLYNQFGSWELALASYNAGPGRVQQAINRNRAAGLPTDYWSLKLPTETMNYVPRFLAVGQIIRNPEQYGITLPSIANRPHFREIQLPGVVDLTLAASIAGLSFQELYELNPGYRSSYTDPMGPNRLLIPTALNAQVDQRLRAMPTLAQTNPSLMASLGPVAGATIIGGGNSSTSRNSFSNQQAAALMSAGSTNTTSTSSIVTRTNTPITNPLSTANSSPNVSPNTSITTTVSKGGKVLSTTASSAPTPITSTPSTSVRTLPATAALIAQTAKRITTPRSSNALAEFASQADLPSSPRIPVSVTPARNIQQLGEPTLSQDELRGLSVATAAAVKSEPAPNLAEKAKIVAELQALAPAGTQVVDPLDGKIQLTAIQTSQSVSESRGQELKIKYEQPVLVAQKNTSNRVKEKPTATVVETNKKPQGERTVYVVQSGDTLASIASRYSVSWRDVADWNQIEPSKSLFVGTSLYLYNAKKPQPVRPTSYTVQSGDTLTAVAAKFNLSNQQLADMNNLTPTSNLLRGARLSLVDDGTSKTNTTSSKPDTPVSAAPSKSTKIETVNYRVKAGESVGSLANRYNMSNEQLAELNKFSANSSLLLGQSIKVPAAAPEAEDKPDTSRKTQAAAKVTTVSYTIKSGDTLSSIATRYQISNDELAKMNKMSATSMVILGQKLTVPDSEVPEAEKTPTSYTVQSGDTLTGVAARFKLSPQELADMNGLKANSNLIRGTNLSLVASSASNKKAADKKADTDANAKESAKESAKEATASKSGASGDTESYTVSRGESLNSIAAKYDLSVAELAKFNKVAANSMVQIGQSLKVPKLTSNYTVKRGDTLIRVASKHGVSVDDLAKMNKISPTTNVKLGEVLVVPNSSL